MGYEGFTGLLMVVSVGFIIFMLAYKRKNSEKN